MSPLNVCPGVMTSRSMSGVMSTASGVVFAGDNEGNFMAFDGRTGKNLWFYSTGAPIWGAAPMTYMHRGKQYIVVATGSGPNSELVALSLP